jgi:hypothetical protein
MNHEIEKLNVRLAFLGWATEPEGIELFYYSEYPAACSGDKGDKGHPYPT